MKTFTLTASLLLLSIFSFAQFTISGKVVSKNNAKPIINANVFISNATINTTTAADGSFKLKDIAPGVYQIIVTNVGFETINQTVAVTNNNITLPVFLVSPKVNNLSEVKVKNDKAANAENAKYLSFFKAAFLGTTDLAQECKILNPELIDFHYNVLNNTITASSVDFLIIKNEALGYTLKYLLKNCSLTYTNDSDLGEFSYSGYVLFEAMQGDADQIKLWQSRRQDVYEGSQLQFLRSGIVGNWSKDGFRVLRLPANPKRPPEGTIAEKLKFFEALSSDKSSNDSLAYWRKMAALPKFLRKTVVTPVNKEDVLTGPDNNGLYTFNTGGDAFFITYDKLLHFGNSSIDRLSLSSNKTNTLLSFVGGNTLVDRNGVFVYPEELQYEGAWLNGRIATLLPSNYQPSSLEESNIDSAVVKRITTAVGVFEQDKPNEKTYLHFDKPYYIAGDTMYFKAYTTAGFEHRPTQLSGVLYADLINPAHKIMQTLTLNIVNGVTAGDFALPKTLPKGSYSVRAYTSWMRNDTAGNFFDKTILIGNPANTRELTPKLKTVKGKVSIAFFS